MKCDEVQNSLSDFFEGSLSTEKIDEIQSHLSACSRCQGEAEKLTQTRKAIKNLSPVQPPPGFSQRVMERVREEGQKSSFWQRNFPAIKVIATVNAVALIGVIGITLLLRRGEVPQEMKMVMSPSDIQIAARDDVARLEQESEALSVPLKSRSKKEPKVMDEVSQKDILGNRVLENISEDSREKVGRSFSEPEILEQAEKDKQIVQRTDLEISLIPNPELTEKKEFLSRLNQAVAKAGGEWIDPKTKFSEIQREIWILVPDEQLDQFITELASLGSMNAKKEKIQESKPSAMHFSIPSTSPIPSVQKRAMIKPDSSFIAVKLILLPTEH